MLEPGDFCDNLPRESLWQSAKVIQREFCRQSAWLEQSESTTCLPEAQATPPFGGLRGPCFERGPFRLELLFARQLFAFGDRFEFLVDLRQLALVQSQLGDAALVIDRHRRLVGHGALDVVDAD